MAGLQPGDSAHHRMSESGTCNSSHDRLEERDKCSANWYMIRKEIEEDSPSRKDGIDLKKEAYFRKSYCTFLQDLGMRLKVPQVTIATAIIFCHRFFLLQSHAKNERREEYEKQKELILLGERVVLATLGFDLNVHHPYKPLVEAIKKFKVAQNALAQVAWNFVNDGLRTSLCLQFKPHHIAAGAIFLAAKFLKVKLPSDGDKVWWQEFDVNPRQLEEVSNQMLELYEQNRLAPPPQSNGSEADVSDGGAKNNPCSLGKTSATEEQPTSVSGFSSQAIVSKIGESSTARQSIESDSQRNSVQNPADGMNDHEERDCTNKGNHHLEKSVENGEMNEGSTPLEGQEKKPTDGVSNGGSGVKASTKGSSDVIKRIDKEKVKAALEKRRKSRAEDLGKKPDVMDDYDIIERELENGVEMAERERKQMNSITSSKVHSVNANQVKADHDHAEVSERSVDCREGLRREALDTNDNAEGGELSSLDVPAHPPREHPSPVSNSRKRKTELSPFNRDVRPDYYHDRERNHRNYRQEPSHV